MLRVVEPRVIVGQMRLTNFLMLRILFIAVAVGAEAVGMPADAGTPFARAPQATA